MRPVMTRDYGNLHVPYMDVYHITGMISTDPNTSSYHLSVVAECYSYYYRSALNMVLDDLTL
jgi:hypothetical protein